MRRGWYRIPCEGCDKQSRCYHGESCARLKRYLRAWLQAVREQTGYSNRQRKTRTATAPEAGRPE